MSEITVVRVELAFTFNSGKAWKMSDLEAFADVICQLASNVSTKDLEKYAARGLIRPEDVTRLWDRVAKDLEDVEVHEVGEFDG